MDDTQYWAALASVQGMGMARFEELEAHFGDISEAWRASSSELRHAGLTPKLANGIRAKVRETDLDWMMEELENFDVEVVTAKSDRYPSLLREIFDPPAVLYVKGELRSEDGEGIAVIGTRRCTRYGMEMCDDIAGGIATAGVTVVSGLARGIDTAAHRATLDNGGRTVAVLGSGLGRIYPPENRGIAEEIAEQGCVISEYPLHEKPLAGNFPLRNRIIVGLSRGVVVVESPQKGGIRRTVNWALESNREVFAVPGELSSEMSKGTNRFLREGANIATCAEDVIEVLSMFYPDAAARLASSQESTDVDGEPSGKGGRTCDTIPATMVAAGRTEAPASDDLESAPVDIDSLGDDESAVSRYLAETGAAHSVDEIARVCGLQAQVVNTALTMLQLRRLVTCLEGTLYRIVSTGIRHRSVTA